MKTITKYNVSLVHDREYPYDGDRVYNPPSAAQIAGRVLGDPDRECTLVMALDPQLRMIGCHVASIGGVDEAVCYPREVFTFLILAKASGFVFVHNHITGSLEPSPDDMRTVNRLGKAGEILGIGMEDALIIGARGRDGRWPYFSFRERGKL